MLTQLTTIKTRLGLLDTDTTNDVVLTHAIIAVSARFNRECNRTLERTEDLTEEFPADAVEICPACYPIETIGKFELKVSEAEGWVEQTLVMCLVRRRCVISLARPVGGPQSQARVTYTGGYVLPGTAPTAGQVVLPADLEQAAVEQVAFWFQNRDRLGLQRVWDYHATYRHFAALDLLPSVKAVLFGHTRWQG